MESYPISPYHRLYQSTGPIWPLGDSCDLRCCSQEGNLAQWCEQSSIWRQMPFSREQEPCKRELCPSLTPNRPRLAARHRFLADQCEKSSWSACSCANSPWFACPCAKSPWSLCPDENSSWNAGPCANSLCSTCACEYLIK